MLYYFQYKTMLAAKAMLRLQPLAKRDNVNLSSKITATCLNKRHVIRIKITENKHLSSLHYIRRALSKIYVCYLTPVSYTHLDVYKRQH